MLYAVTRLETNRFPKERQSSGSSGSGRSAGHETIIASLSYSLKEAVTEVGVVIVKMLVERMGKDWGGKGDHRALLQCGNWRLTRKYHQNGDALLRLCLWGLAH